VGLLALPVALPQMGLGLILVLLTGGLVYTFGAVIFAIGRPNFHPAFGHHELWHLFVMAGSTVFFIAVLLYVVV
jgi:hemolysin III